MDRIERRGETRERERKRKREKNIRQRLGSGQRGIGTVRVDTRFDWGTKQAHESELRELTDGWRVWICGERELTRRAKGETQKRRNKERG